MSRRHEQRAREIERENAPEEYRKGATLDELGAKYGVTKQAMHGWLARRGVIFRAGGSRIRSKEEIAAEEDGRIDA